jgi:hypothetical protein
VSESVDLAIIGPLIRVAAIAAEGLSPKERADVYEGIAHVAKSSDPALAEDARLYAQAMRDAEHLQLHFKDLFRNQP